MEYKASWLSSTNLQYVSAPPPAVYFPSYNAAMPTPDPWLPEPTNNRLTASGVHIWRVWLDQDQDTCNAMRALLSADEIVRADRFIFDHLRARYTIGRGVLRLLAGRFLGLAAAAVKFTYGDHGKPCLPDSPLKFNVSNSHQLALIAFGLGREIGVDIEWMKPLPEGERIARRFFSTPEVDDFLRVPDPLRESTFYACWTRKEAYIKAIGDGLAYPLDQFRVSLTPGEPARLLEVRPNPSEVARWGMAALHPGENYRAAVIAEGQDWLPALWDYRFDAVI